MELDPDEVFADDEDELESASYQGKEATKELAVYLVDASPKMFSTTCQSDNGDDESHFHVAVSCIAQCLKTQIINSSYDELAICFFNTREKKNIQDLPGVYVFNVADREYLDRPTARLIKEFDYIEESFSKLIGSQYGILAGSRNNSLYNALWVAQALLRKGSTKTADKRILLFTNEDDPFGSINGITKKDMIRTTLQRAKDAQELGISIELLPLNRPNEEFNASHFYAELLGLEDDDLNQFMPSALMRIYVLLNACPNCQPIRHYKDAPIFIDWMFDDLKNQLRKRIFKKRKVRRITFTIANALSIELSTYALIRPTVPGQITWLDSVTNLPLKTERSFVCTDTGTLLQEPPKQSQSYKNEDIKFSSHELSEIKRISTGHLRLLGFKPLSCLKDYHNLRPSTFLFPSDEEVAGSTCVFIALHKSMLKLKRYAVAFYGSSTHPQLVALIAQDEILTGGGQVEPPGMHMIYLPYSDDIRHTEEVHTYTGGTAPRATDDHVKKATALMRRIDLKEFSVCQFANPALQRHYAMVQAMALDEDEVPEIADETLPDAEGMARPGVVKALEEFKLSIYGENYEEEVDLAVGGKGNALAKKRKAEDAAKESTNYDWSELADNGKLKDLTVAELKLYLTAHSLPVAGKKELLVNRILSHLGK